MNHASDFLLHSLKLLPLSLFTTLGPLGHLSFLLPKPLFPVPQKNSYFSLELFLQ